MQVQQLTAQPQTQQHRSEMLVIFGLGNPGRRYEGTRHNAGVETLSKLAASYRKKLVRRCFSSYRLCQLDSDVRLVFPLTYMNSSGEVVPSVTAPGDRVIVICDQMDLPCGRLRLREGGSSAGHNGLKSMLAALPDNFIRLYIGVGRPEENVSVIDHVLTRFNEHDRMLVDQAENAAVSALRELISGEDIRKVEQKANSFRPSGD